MDCGDSKTSRAALRPRAESGQALVLTAIVMVVLLGFVGLVIDVGRAYQAQRVLQSQADAAALAGAQDLPDATQAVAVAHQYSGEPGRLNARDNVPGVVTTATTECREEAPCNPVNAVVVEDSAAVPTVFAKVLGIDSIEVSARAVALARPGEHALAIFAHDSDCGGFSFKANPSDFHVDGAIRSNGDFVINGENVYAGYASAHGPPCLTDVDGSNIHFGGSDEPEYDPTIHPWPRWYEQSEFTCTYTANKFEFNQDNLAIPDGVYCATELFKIDGNYNTGRITVLAPQININGIGHVFRPYELGVLFFAAGTQEMILNGYAYDWEGVIFHPNGRVKINGDDTSVLTGMVEAREVEVNGSSFNMVGKGLTGGTSIQLIE